MKLILSFFIVLISLSSYANELTVDDRLLLLDNKEYPYEKRVGPFGLTHAFDLEPFTNSESLKKLKTEYEDRRYKISISSTIFYSYLILELLNIIPSPLDNGHYVEYGSYLLIYVSYTYYQYYNGQSALEEFANTYNAQMSSRSDHSGLRYSWSF